MGRKAELKNRRARQQRARRLTTIGIAAGAVILAAIIILPIILKPSAGTINAITLDENKRGAKGTSLGNPDARVKLDVWEDFQCSACLAYTTKLEPQLLQQYVYTGDAYYTFHFYPFIDGGQGESHDAANAALCAAAQDRFWDYHDMLFANWLGENAGSFTRPRLFAFAQKLDLDMTAFTPCLQSDKFASVVQQDFEAGRQKGITSTPAIFVNGKQVLSAQGEMYSPTFQEISRAIDAALAGK